MRPELRINLQVFLLLSTLLITASQIVIPPASRAENDPSVRHKKLAALISNELNLRKDSRAGYKPFVHWVHLNRDAFVDAIVILKQHDSSCALQSTCLGFVVQGGVDGFHMISSFSANHHPLYLAPRPGSTSLRTLYHSEDGDDYDEIVFSNSRYHVARQGLSVGRVREQAYQTISEEQFDDLATQAASVEKLGSQPAGAPAIVRVPDPPTSLVQHADENTRKSNQVAYELAITLRPHIQRHFSALAKHQVLSHSVTIELVFCDDWMTRVPLVHQRDRSSRHVVGCLELLKLLNTQKIVDKLKESIAIQKQYEMLLYLLEGTFGQALAIQSNALEGVVRQMRRSSQFLPQVQNQLEARLTRNPSTVFYLLGSTVAEKAGHSAEPDSVFLYQMVIGLFGEETRGEYSTLLGDFLSRYTATLCAKYFAQGEGNMNEFKRPFPGNWADQSILDENANFQACKTLSQALREHAQG